MLIGIILMTILSLASCQRPTYAGSNPIGYPGLASRFKDENTSTSSSVNNRLGEVDGTTQRLPVDARGDVNLVNRINQWPRETRPFWYINAEHIERQRNPQGSATRRSLSDRSLQTRGGFGDPESDPTSSLTDRDESFLGILP